MIGIFLIFGLESIIYVNHKAKANLFLQIKVIAIQEEQLKNLLDTVPDKVLIVSKPSDAVAAKNLYSNRQMNEFFGGDVVELSKLCREHKAPDMKSRLRDPTKRSIFKEYRLQQRRNGTMEHEEQEMSLQDILSKNNHDVQLAALEQRVEQRRNLYFQVSNSN